MDYRLIVLTHGENATLNETLTSFARWVRPMPVDAVLVYDGAVFDTPPLQLPAMTWEIVTTNGPVGFCKASALAWEKAGEATAEKVFWLENDFVFTRPVDLDVIAAVMDEHPDLSQMALYRNPVNPEEITHGGYLNIPARRGEYVTKITPVEMIDRVGHDDYERSLEEMPWFEHRGYWTTNPSLVRTDVIREFDWPVEARCEGMFGFTLKAGRPGTTFGVWGDGDVWVEHVGARHGFGY